MILPFPKRILRGVVSSAVGLHIGGESYRVLDGPMETLPVDDCTRITMILYHYLYICLADQRKRSEDNKITILPMVDED